MAERATTNVSAPRDAELGAEDDKVTALIRDEAVARIRARHVSRAAISGDNAQVISTGALFADETDAEAKQRQRLTRNAQIMKRALFNAGKRLERKHSAGQFTFALSGVYGFLVPLFTLQFEPFLTALVTYVISFTAATAGAISFVVAMLYQQQDLKRRARLFYDAGRRMNKLGKDLVLMQSAPLETLRHCVHHYDEILAHTENHDEIDYEYAMLGYRPRDNKDGRQSRWIRERRRLDIRFMLQTYGLLLAVWLLPPLIGVIIWTSFAK